MIYNLKDFELILFIFLWNCYTSQARHTIMPRSIPSFITSSYYESLKETLKPVLSRSNVSSQGSLEPEADYDYSNKDSPDVEEPPAHIFEHNRNNISNQNGKYSRADEISGLAPLSSPDCNLRKFYKFESVPFKHHWNKSSITPSENEKDYDYSNQDNPDVEEPPAPIFEHRHGNNTRTQKIVKSLVEKLRHGVQVKNTESLYEKYKANLSPLIKRLNKSSVVPRKHSEAFRYITENHKNVRHPLPDKFSSLYDEFKKRLVNFSSELDIDAGLRNSKKHTSMINQISDKENVHDNENKDIHGDHVTAEFRKVQNIVDRMEKETPLTTNKLYESENLQKENIPFSQPTNFVDWNYLKNEHRIDTGQQVVSSGNYIYNDYNYDDNYRPLPIFRKQEVPLTQKKRRLRGIEDFNNDYLTWSNNRGTDGSAYNKFYPTVYTDPINSELANLSAQGLLENIARRLNISTLEVAKKVAGIQGLNLSTLKKEPQLHKILQEYIENTVIAAAQSVGVRPSSPGISPDLKKKIKNVPEIPKIAVPKDLPFKDTRTPQVSESLKPQQHKVISTNLQQYVTALDKGPSELVTLPPIEAEKKDGVSTKEVSDILGKLMQKIENIQSEKDQNITCHPLEDSPCKVSGSWLSKAIGLRFDISLKEKSKKSKLVSDEASSLALNVSIQEYTPPKPHDIMDTDWPITGSALKGNGGPFFLYAQKRSENILATFVGYCRNCGGLDTVYGTWTFSFPSKGCQDTPASFQTKNDVMRRYKLEEKRLERNRAQNHKKTKSWSMSV